MSYRQSSSKGEQNSSSKLVNSTHSNIFGGAKAEGIPSKEQPRPARKYSGRTAPVGVRRLDLGFCAENDDDEMPNGFQHQNGGSSDDILHYTAPPIKISVISPTHQRKRSGGLSSGRPKKHDFVPNLELDLSASSDALQAMRAAAEDAFRDIEIEYVDDNQGFQMQSQNILGKQRKQQIVEEALLADQMDRMSMTKRPNSHTVMTRGGHRNDTRQQALRPSSSTTSSSQSDLKKRLRFGARILTKSDRDALREINGFFFTSDSSITMYEFRQFGTRSNALPFITRGSYSHLFGTRRKQPYCILDIYVGSELAFETKTQMSLPDALRQDRTVRFIVTDLDESAKESLVYDGCLGHRDRHGRGDWVEKYTADEDHELEEFLYRIQRATQASLRKRAAVKTLIGLRKQLNNFDKSGKGLVTREQIMSSLRKFRLDVSVQDFATLADVVQQRGDGSTSLDAYTFLRYFIGEMNETRKAAARRAFMKMDHAKTGVIRVTELTRFYLAKQHPAVISGKRTESEERKSLQAAFADTQISGEVKLMEFEDYCEGLSLAFDSDDKFTAFMRLMWGI